MPRNESRGKALKTSAMTVILVIFFHQLGWRLAYSFLASFLSNLGDLERFRFCKLYNDFEI